jgi:ferric-dicitrate binding protein FerR (iron transport regulator)
MSTAFAPIDAATIASLNKGDEAALETIFRTHYDVLLERALERLKDEKPAAPRLVAAVIRELWEEREGFHSTTEIEGFINEELRQRARAVRSRMAAVHRFEKTEGVKAHEAHAPPSADQLWKEIASALHQPMVDPAVAAKKRREHLAHEAAGHIAQVAKPRNWRTPAILVAVGALALWGGYTWASKASKSSVITMMLAASDAPQVVTRPGQLGNFALGDSSIVRLGADTKIIRVANFGREYRSATVTGTAAINVGSGSTLPFEMRIGEASITATGGEFAVRDYANEPARYVQARSDGIAVTLPTGARTLKAGETLVITRDSTMRDATADEAAFAFGWLDGKLVLKEVPVRDAMQALYRWYGLDIAVRDSVVLDRPVSLDVPIESSQMAIAALETAGELKFEWVDTRMTFKDARRP